MGKKSFSNSLLHTIEKQDESLKDRFAIADSLLMSTPSDALKRKNTTEIAKGIGIPAIPRDDSVIRDTFSMPKNDYALIDKIKVKALKQQTMVTKSEIIRAGLIFLDSVPSTELKDLLRKVVRIKTGRKSK